MATLKKLNAVKREEFGKGPSRRIRATGNFPAIFYNQKGENVSVTINAIEYMKLYRTVGRTEVFELVVENGITAPVLVWRVKSDPIKSSVVHVDFFGVDLEKEIKIRVPIKIVGKPIGVAKGGKMEIYREACDVYAKPLDIPTLIEVDVTDMDNDTLLRISEITPPKNVRIASDDNFVVLNIFLNGAAETEEDAPAKQ